jgi:hypothetical protein
MFKRLLLIAALAASIAACGPSGGSSAPGGSVAPIESIPADSLAPSESPSTAP